MSVWTRLVSARSKSIFSKGPNGGEEKEESKLRKGKRKTARDTELLLLDEKRPP